jgi:hypothetical protein
MRRRGRGHEVVTWFVVAAVIGVFLACGGRTVPPIPTCAVAPVDTVATVSPDEVWVAGELGTLLHLSGGKWTSVANPAGQVNLTKIVMLSSDEGWAVGTTGTDARFQQAVILHYSAGQWVAVKSPTSVSLVSPTEGWAVGDGAMFHYADGQWTTTYTAAFLESVAMVSPEEGWAAGGWGEGPYGAAMLHDVNGQWIQTLASSRYLLLPTPPPVAQPVPTAN